MMDETKYECLKLSNQLCFPLYAGAKELVRRYKPYLEKLDLTYTQYITLMVLWERGPLSLKEIGCFLYLDSGTLTPLLKKLEKKGYIERSRSSKDERSVMVSTTPAGDILREEACKIPTEMGKCIDLSPEEVGTLYTLLYKLLYGMETQLDSWENT